MVLMMSLLLLLLPGLSGCAAAGKVRRPATSDSKTKDQDAEAYFRKFIYRKRKVAGPGGKSTLMVTRLILDSPFPVGDGLMANFTLYLLPNNTYALKYQEGSANAGGEFSPDNMAEFRGNWQIVGNSLRLENLADATAAQVVTRSSAGKNVKVDGIGFTLGKDIASKGSAGRAFLMLPLQTPL